MAGMFRINGMTLDIDRLLASIPWRPSMSYRKGEPCSKVRPRGKKNKKSGANFVVSDAAFAQFNKQKRDAIECLKTIQPVFKKIMNWPGLDEGSLDFGIYRRDVIAQFDKFPAELLKLAGDLGIDIELSCYPLPEEKQKSKKPTRKRTVRRRRP